MPKQLQFSCNEPHPWPAEGETAAALNSSSTTTRKIDSPLDRRKQELAENVSFLEAQISSAEDHLAKLKGEHDLLQTVSRGRICSHCHQSGHNRNNCRGIACDSHTKCKLKDKHPHCKMKRANLALKMGPKRVSPDWYCTRADSVSLKWGRFSTLFRG